MYPKDTEKWKQFTTDQNICLETSKLFCIPKILKNESNSQLTTPHKPKANRCFVSQRYWKMKAIHNTPISIILSRSVVLYPKDTEKWKQFTTSFSMLRQQRTLFCIPKILKNESNSQLQNSNKNKSTGCFVSQRYWKMKAIHNGFTVTVLGVCVVLYPKDTEKWKQFTTVESYLVKREMLFCIPKILKNESNSQLLRLTTIIFSSCFVSQRYWKMKAIHNRVLRWRFSKIVVLYPKDTEKWKQFTTISVLRYFNVALFCIPKILKNESNSQQQSLYELSLNCCFVSQRYWKMKAIHNNEDGFDYFEGVVLYPKDTEKWKQFTTRKAYAKKFNLLFCIPKILKNESNSQLILKLFLHQISCFVSQRYWKMKAIHNISTGPFLKNGVVLYPKDTEKWKQFTTRAFHIMRETSLFCIPKILKNESNSQRVSTEHN